MKPRPRKAKKTQATSKKLAFVVPADFSPKQTQVAWEEFLKAQPTIDEQPKPMPEIGQSDHHAKLRSYSPPLNGLPNKQGRPRRDLKKSGVHLILWGAFQRVRKKSPSVEVAWGELSSQNRKKWFMSVSSLCFSKDGPTIGDCFSRAYLAAPDMTLAVLPALRRAALGTTKVAYIAACYGWHDPDPKTMKYFTSAERDIRRRMRNALDEFVAETA